MRDLDPRLHGYQRRAVAHLHGTGEPGAGLFMDMGLGKTASVLQALEPDHLPALVLAPKRVAEEVWHEERRIWRPNLSVAVAVGSPAQRARARDARADVTVMSRDTIKDLVGRGHPYRTVVLDELSGYKSGGRQGSARWKDTAKVTKDVPHVWGLTGTPAPNGYMDLWAQVYLLDRGKRLGTTLTAFRDRYFDVARRLPVTNVVIEWRPKPGAEARINALLDDLCLSMVAEDYLDLPEFTINHVKVPLPPDARKVYEEMERTLVADLDLLGVGTGTFTAANAAGMSGRLRQVLAGFMYEDNSTAGEHVWLHDARVKAVEEILDGIGSPALVFYQYGAEKRALMKAIPGVRTIDEKGVVADWNAGRVRALLAHPQSAGHGLNLQRGGHHIVWSSLTWSLEEWMQANKRLHRQGQRNAVVVHVPCVPGSVDTVVLNALADKKSVQDAVMGYLSEDERLLR